MNIQEVFDQIESFGVESDEVTDEVYEVEDLEAFSEWLEKTNGDVRRALELYPLPVDMEVRDETLRMILPVEGWNRYDPTNPVRFECGCCSNEYVVVETSDARYAGYGAVNVNSGFITDSYTFDRFGMFYNTGSEELLCGNCATDLQSVASNGADSIRVFRPTMKDVKIYSKNGVWFDEGSVSSQYAEFTTLNNELQEIVENAVQKQEADAVKVTSTSEGYYDSSFPRKGLNQFVFDMIQNTNPDEYKFGFQVVAVGRIRRGFEIAGGYFYIPDSESEEAVEEVKSWITEERMRKFRRDRMR